MITILKKTALHDLLKEPILFDANIFMVGVSERNSDKNCSFDNMKELYIRPLFESFTNIIIHEEVYKELDEESKNFVDEYIGKNIIIVKEGDLYGKDPLYTDIFNDISNHELVNYKRGRSKDRGEIYSLAYAVYYNINYFCSREIMVDIISNELDELGKMGIVTFDIILLQAYVYFAQKNDKSHSKALKALYKKYCADVIKRHGLPATLSEYIKASQEYL